tara:strand:- start:5 stop:199 length:195 start_codon:yes stop_codon:yes gene_type:complete
MLSYICTRFRRKVLFIESWFFAELLGLEGEERRKKQLLKIFSKKFWWKAKNSCIFAAALKNKWC